MFETSLLALLALLGQFKVWQYFFITFGAGCTVQSRSSHGSPQRPPGSTLLQNDETNSKSSIDL